MTTRATANPAPHRTTTTRLTILLLDDDAALADELHVFGHETVTVSSGRSALEAIEQTAFDAIVFDRVAAEPDAIMLLQHARESGIALPIVLLSTRALVQDKIEALRAGADDYLVKPVAPAELEARLWALVRGRHWRENNRSAISAGDITINVARFRASRNGRPIDLARLEFHLLAELVRNAGAVLSRETLLERVWRYDAAPGSNVVEAYVRRLRAKLTADGGDDPIATVRGVGYRLRD